MLDIGVNINVDVKNVKQPIRFERKNICVHCGAKGMLNFVDKFGNKSSKEIHAFDHIKCFKCGKNYSILWTPEEDGDKMYPTAVDYTVQKEFTNILTNTFFKGNQVKEFE